MAGFLLSLGRILVRSCCFRILFEKDPAKEVNFIDARASLRSPAVY